MPMAKYSFHKGPKANLPSVGLVEGHYYQCTDTGELYLATSATTKVLVAIGDAPSDGKTYGRKDGSWNETHDAGDVQAALDDEINRAIARENEIEDAIPAISTNVTTDKTSNSKTASPKAVYDIATTPIVNNTSTAAVSVSLDAGKKYKYMRSAGVTSLSFSLNAAPDSAVNAFWYIKFRSGSTPTSVSWPTGLYFDTDDGLAPDIEANTIYEIMIDEDKCLSFLTYKLS